MLTGRDLLYGGLCQLAAALLLLPVHTIAYAIINLSRADRLLKQRREGSASGDMRANDRHDRADH
jgi:hypothetical protein